MTQIVSFDVGIRNLAYCVVNDGQITHWSKEDLGCKRHDMQGIVDAMIRLLEVIVASEIDNTKHVDVLIEQQMSASMKCIQTAIEVYFKTLKTRKVLDATTHYVSPKLKLKLIASHTDFVSLLSKTSKYDQNKADAVGFATWYLTKKTPDPIALEVLNSVKKKDDLADVFLQAIAWESLRLKPYKVSEHK